MKPVHMRKLLHCAAVMRCRKPPHLLSEVRSRQWLVARIQCSPFVPALAALAACLPAWVLATFYILDVMLLSNAPFARPSAG